MVKIVEKAVLANSPEVLRFDAGIRIEDKVRIIEHDNDGKMVIEWISNDGFGQAWRERQQYEIDAGQQEEPILYSDIYSMIEDPNLPENVSVNRLGPAGVVFARVAKGGEVQFATMSDSNFVVPMYQYAVGVKYPESLVLFNNLFDMAEIERQAGIAFNALRNHVHLSPIFDPATPYAGTNTIAYSSLTYADADPTPLRYAQILEAAMTQAMTEPVNRKPGPYALLVPGTRLFTWEKALQPVTQVGLGASAQSSAIRRVQTLIAYDGWTGQLDDETSVVYPGVTAGRAYLIDLQYRRRNFRSYLKRGLTSRQGNPDVSRFILSSTVWDSWFGTYAAPTNAVVEITGLP